jgi:hypothetical protein
VVLNEVGVRFRVSPRTIWRIVDGEAIILALDGGQYFGLNSVGTRMWILLHEGLAPAAIQAQILQEFDADPVELEADIDFFLQELLKKGLVESKDDPIEDS